MSNKGSTIATDIALRNKGIVTFSDRVTAENVKWIIHEILYVNEFKPEGVSTIKLIVNSNGGSIAAGFLLTDVMEYSRLPVATIGMGICASMGMMILCAGAEGQRVVTKNTILLCHQHSNTSSMKYHDLVAGRKCDDFIHKRLVLHLTKHSKLTQKKVEKLLMSESDAWITPAQALEYGLVDKILS